MAIASYIFWELCKFVKTVKIISARDELFTARPDTPSIQLMFINSVRPGFLLPEKCQKME